MSIGDAEIKTQERVIRFFKDPEILGYQYIGNLSDYQNKNITIQTKKVVENYYHGVTGGSAGGTYTDHFKSWENNEVGYFKITVSCAELNLQQVFSFRITSSISGVGLSQSTITF